MRSKIIKSSNTILRTNVSEIEKQDDGAKRYFLSQQKVEQAKSIAARGRNGFDGNVNLKIASGEWR